MNPEQIIQTYADENNLIFGICDGEPLLPKSLPLEAPFVHWPLEDRINPKRALPETASIIVLGMGYKKEIAPKPTGGLKRGRISMGAIGLDYHIVLKKHLHELAGLLLENAPFLYRIFVDTGPLVERTLAIKAGMGWQGKNHQVISPVFGTFFFIGYMVTSLKLAPTGERVYHPESQCGDCRRCLAACPGKVLSGTGGEPFQYHRCVSYLTQKKEELTPEEKASMGDYLYGCDICQLVCPWNRHVKGSKIVLADDAYPLIQDILELTGNGFKTRFGHTAMGWRGKKVIQRNAAIVGMNLKR